MDSENYRGKGRRQQRAENWRTVAISTGEVDIETYLKTSGIKVKVGQLVRLLNIPIQKPRSYTNTATERITLTH